MKEALRAVVAITVAIPGVITVATPAVIMAVVTATLMIMIVTVHHVAPPTTIIIVVAGAVRIVGAVIIEAERPAIRHRHTIAVAVAIDMTTMRRLCRVTPTTINGLCAARSTRSFIRRRAPCIGRCGVGHSHSHPHVLSSLVYYHTHSVNSVFI